MFEPQDHPSDFAYPGAAPTAPYDIAGWTLAYQMAVQFDRILDPFDAPLDEIQGPVPPPAANVAEVEGAKGFVLDARMNDSFRAVNRLLAAGQEVRRLAEPLAGGSNSYAPGSFYIPRAPTTLPLLERTAQELGTPFRGVQIEPGKEAVAIQP